MRFFLDHNVDDAVRRVLTDEGHHAWNASQAGLSGDADDFLTIYADDKNATLITHDREFSNRRSHRVVGRHIWLECNEWDAAELLKKRLPEIVKAITRFEDVFVHITTSRVTYSHQWD